MRRFSSVTAVAAAVILALTACEAEDDPVSPDPDGLEDPGDDPDGVDAPLEEDPEEGAGEPALEGEEEGQFAPEDQDDDAAEE